MRKPVGFALGGCLVGCQGSVCITVFLEARLLSQLAHRSSMMTAPLSKNKTLFHTDEWCLAHIQVDKLQPLRRPISIMRVSASEGWVDFLYKRLGTGTSLLAERVAGETVSMIAPIGNSFDVKSKRSLLIGGGVGMPPMIFWMREG